MQNPFFVLYIHHETTILWAKRITKNMPKNETIVGLTVNHTYYSKEAEKQAKRKAIYAFEREYGKGLAPEVTLKGCVGCSYTYQFKFEEKIKTEE